MESSRKLAMMLASGMFVVGLVIIFFITLSAANNTCIGFDVTGQVTDPLGENTCSDLFSTSLLHALYWIVAWCIVCFFVFLIVLEYIQPQARVSGTQIKHRKKSGKISKIQKP